VDDLVADEDDDCRGQQCRQRADAEQHPVAHQVEPLAQGAHPSTAAADPGGVGEAVLIGGSLDEQMPFHVSSNRFFTELTQLTILLHRFHTVILHDIDTICLSGGANLPAVSDT
jgi:hypothetical protein